MNGTPSPLADLLAECDAQGIRLLLADDGGLTIDAPQDGVGTGGMDECEFENHFREDRQTRWPDGLAPVVPQLAKFTANGTGRKLPIPRCVRLVGQQRRHCPQALLPNDR
ncbi:MAG: hypothetical protein IT425_12490 [Pirellulales bacterium]|nr:hypothetical protein [Pirellulales bacterium]